MYYNETGGRNSFLETKGATGRTGRPLYFRNRNDNYRTTVILSITTPLFVGTATK